MFAEQMVVGEVAKLEALSPAIKPLYEIVKVGFGLPSTFVWLSAIIVRVAFITDNVPFT